MWLHTHTHTHSRSLLSLLFLVFVVAPCAHTRCVSICFQHYGMCERVCMKFVVGSEWSAWEILCVLCVICVYTYAYNMFNMSEWISKSVLCLSTIAACLLIGLSFDWMLSVCTVVAVVAVTAIVARLPLMLLPPPLPLLLLCCCLLDLCSCFVSFRFASSILAFNNVKSNGVYFKMVCVFSIL